MKGRALRSPHRRRLSELGFEVVRPVIPGFRDVALHVTRELLGVLVAGMDHVVDHHLGTTSTATGTRLEAGSTLLEARHAGAEST